MGPGTYAVARAARPGQLEGEQLLAMYSQIEQTNMLLTDHIQRPILNSEVPTNDPPKNLISPKHPLPKRDALVSPYTFSQREKKS